MSEDIHPISCADLLNADRVTVLGLLSAAVNSVTIDARAAYDKEDAVEALMAKNEVVHRLSGHLRDLCDFREPLTESRAQAIVDGVQTLSPILRMRLQTRLRSSDGELMV